MSKWNITLIGALIFAGYFSYNCWQDEKAANEEVIRLNNKVNAITKQNEENNKIIIKREQEKSQANLAVKKLQEELKNALKDNKCANELIPRNILNKLHERSN